MRYEKSQALLRLAFQMQGTAQGVSLADIIETYQVSRRTAERMRDAVREVFPQVEEVSLGDGLKRWRIRSSRAITAIPVLTDELATLHAAAERFRQEGQPLQADQLDTVLVKLRSLIRNEDLRRMEPDYDALVEAEGFVLHPGPRPRINSEILVTLRDGIKGCEELILRYFSRFSGQESQQQVRPYGLLYGNRHYLLAFNGDPEVDGFRLFSLANIREVAKTGIIFERHDGFSLRAYAENAFGVFQEKPFDVVWQVAPEAADDARAFLFHPSQHFEDQLDGSLIVRFRAGGLVEMAWHLFTWAGQIRALEPPELLETIDRLMGGFVAAHPPRRPPCGGHAGMKGGGPVRNAEFE